MHPVARDFRLYMAARSRYAEDRLTGAVSKGVVQYVILGAGLDTFAYRNPFPSLRVFEVDFPATQQWKREMLAEAAIDIPESLTLVPLDFECKTLAEGLAERRPGSPRARRHSSVGLELSLTSRSMPSAPRLAQLGNCQQEPPSASTMLFRLRR
jgi:hypothetical protein